MNRRLIATAVLLLAFAPALRAAMLGPFEFTEAFATEVKTQRADSQVKILASLRVQLKLPDGSKYTAFLDNAYGEYRNNPERLDAVIKSQMETIKSQDRALSNKTGGSIFAVLKPADYVATVRKQMAQTGAANLDFPMVYEKLNDDLYAYYVFDTDNGMSFITKKDLTEMKLREDALRAISTANLETYFDKHKLHMKLLQHRGAKIYAVSVDDNYEASALLVPKYWTKSNFDVAGEIVVYVPARNVVLVTGSGDDEGVKIASQIAKRAYAEFGYPISPEGYKLQSGSWIPFKR